jgi:hypothetical protein
MSFMPNLETLRDCFKNLANDLFNIRHYPKYELPSQEAVINTITDSDIYECDLEDIQQYIQKYLNDLVALKPQLAAIVDSQPPQDIYRPYPASYPAEREPDPAKELISFLEARLSYYETELKKVQSNVEDKQGELGSDRFAPAGFKLKLNITKEQVAYFFSALVAAGYLTTTNGAKPMKKDLARFINRNFESITGPVISEDGLKNTLSEAKSLPESTAKMFGKLASLTNL